MRKMRTIPAFPFQIILTSLILSVIFKVFTVVKTSKPPGTMAIQDFEKSLTIYATGTILLTLGICLLIGLPIRLVSTFRSCWIRRPIINFLTCLAGLSLIFLYRKDFFTYEVVYTNTGSLTFFEVGNPYFILTGWFLTAFSLLHFYPASCKIQTRLKK